jgi:hypothetical protein
LDALGGLLKKNLKELLEVNNDDNGGSEKKKNVFLQE